MTTDPTPPEVGSLWEHKSGERRFVPWIHPDGGPFVVTCGKDFCTRVVWPEEWAAWERDAVRIDTAPQGQKETNA